ncbi:hypothetical protein Tco_1413176 [Tanacetum coccineum]
MTNLVKHIIVAGAENRPPMLEKSMYDSWASRIHLFIKGKKHGRMMLDSINNDDYDVQVTNIILYGLPPDVYALVNHQKAAKEIWDRVKMLMKGTELSYQERECRLFSQLINDMHTIGMTMQQQTIPQNSPFQTEELDAYDSDCDDLSSAKAVLMEHLSSCNPKVLSEVPYSDSYPNNMLNQDVQEMQYSEQTHINNFQDNEIHNDSNTILYSQYLQESQDAVFQDTNSSAPNDLLVLSLVEQMTDHVAHLDKENQTNKMVNESLTAELERYKERVTIFEQRLNVDLNKRKKLIDSQMDDLIRDRNAKLAAF